MLLSRLDMHKGGELIYESTNKKKLWNGKQIGKLLLISLS